MYLLHEALVNERIRTMQAEAEQERLVRAYLRNRSLERKRLRRRWLSLLRRPRWRTESAGRV